MGRSIVSSLYGVAHQAMTIVTLTTDFGLEDAYVPSMKGVILSLAPKAIVVDVSHDIPPQDIYRGSLVLEDCFRMFPLGTIHVAVVDPGVGTDRKALIIESEGHFFVGPDNGLFSFCLTDQKARCWKIREDAGLKNRSATFEGRDLFAPVAAKLAEGVAVKELADPLQEKISKSYARSPKIGKDESFGEVISIDHFGNLATNLRISELGDPPRWVVLDGKEIGPIQKTYNDVSRNNLLALENSMGRLEIAVSQGSARDSLKAKVGMKVVVRKAKEE